MLILLRMMITVSWNIVTNEKFNIQVGRSSSYIQTILYIAYHNIYWIVIMTLRRYCSKPSFCLDGIIREDLNTSASKAIMNAQMSL